MLCCLDFWHSLSCDVNFYGMETKPTTLSVSREQVANKKNEKGQKEGPKAAAQSGKRGL
jgi:hypothetical protein